MASLNNEIKAFIVQALACFDTPSQVAKAVKQEFDLDVSRQQVEPHALRSLLQLILGLDVEPTSGIHRGIHGY